MARSRLRTDAPAAVFRRPNRLDGVWTGTLHAMGLGKVALFLTEATNHYQQLLRDDAVSAAQRCGFELEIVSCGLSVSRQLEQLRDALQRPSATRPRAIVLMPAQDATLRDVAREAAAAGIAWVVLNRRATFLDRLPDEFPSLPIFTLSPDDLEVGRVQGRQLRTVLPRGARVLLARGGSGTTAVDREAGLRSALAHSQIDLDVLYGSWSLDGARKALDVHFATPGRARIKLDAIVGQNDEIALAAVQALESAALRFGRPELRQIRVFGCDGLPDQGQRYVREGKFTATVIVPLTSGAAIQVLARAFERNERPPTEVMLPSSSFPDERELSASS
jgi:ABC-type sugar transport system substrate-binding protein